MPVRLLVLMTLLVLVTLLAASGALPAPSLPDQFVSTSRRVVARDNARVTGFIAGSAFRRSFVAIDATQTAVGADDETQPAAAAATSTSKYTGHRSAVSGDLAATSSSGFGVSAAVSRHTTLKLPSPFTTSRARAVFEQARHNQDRFGLILKKLAGAGKGTKPVSSCSTVDAVDVHRAGDMPGVQFSLRARSGDSGQVRVDGANTGAVIKESALAASRGNISFTEVHVTKETTGRAIASEKKSFLSMEFARSRTVDSLATKGSRSLAWSSLAIKPWIGASETPMMMFRRRKAPPRTAISRV